MNTLLYQKLAADSDLVALVGTRITPTRPTPDDALPYLAYTLIDTESFYHLMGASDLNRYEYLFEYWGVTEASCNTIGETLVLAIDGWRDDHVRGAFLRTMTEVQEEPDAEIGYHGEQTWSIFCR